MDKVSRELSGGINAVTRDSTAESIAIGQTIRFPVMPVASIEDVRPQASVPEASGEVAGKRELVISHQKKSSLVWTGNEQLEVGSSLSGMMENQIAQRIRSLVNAVEDDLCNTIAFEGINSGNVIGTAGTPIFSDTAKLTMLTKALKTLQDKGAPTSELQALLNTTESMNMRNLANLQKVNEAGENDLLRRGVLGNLFGFDIRETAGLKAHKVTGSTDYKTNGEASAGTQTITIDTGNKVIDKGHIVTFGDDTKKYVVAEKVSSGGTSLKLTTPLASTVSTGTTVNVVDYQPCVAFDRSSVWLATRTIPVPKGGDLAIDRRVVTDPKTGLSFTVAMYGGYYQNTIEISLAWGTGIIKPENVVTILG